MNTPDAAKPKFKIITRRMWAGFKQGDQVTAWDTRRDKVHAKMRDAFGLRHPSFYKKRGIAPYSPKSTKSLHLTIKGKDFIEKRQIS